MMAGLAGVPQLAASSLKAALDADWDDPAARDHALAHVGHWQGRRARYRGIRKNLFDLRRVAVVHNLHIIARQPVTYSYQLAA